MRYLKWAPRLIYATFASQIIITAHEGLYGRFERFRDFAVDTSASGVFAALAFWINERYPIDFKAEEKRLESK